jgi:Flp pilus assembly protein TadD
VLGSGGIGIWPPVQPAIDERRAWLLSTLGRYEEAESLLRASAERHGMTEILAANIGRVLRGRRDDAATIAWYESVTTEHPQWLGLWDEYVLWLSSDGRDLQAIEVALRKLEEKDHGDEAALFIMRRASLLLAEKGVGPQIEQGIRLVERTLEIEPDNPFAYRALAIGHARMERLEEAEKALRRAVELAPADWRLIQSLGELLMGIDKAAEGAQLLRRAADLRDADRRDR